MKTFSTIAIFLMLQACNDNSAKPVSQQPASYPACEGCEAIFESPIPFAELNAADTLEDFSSPGPSLFINGRVLRNGAPVSNVVLYFYHTNEEGVYPTRESSKGWGKRHGYLRGWISTNAKGNYSFYTKRPAPYPGRRDPAHIHFIIQEPGKEPTYIDDIHFDDDALLTEEMRRRQSNRGGSGIIKLQMEGGLNVGTRDIHLDSL